MPTYLYYCDTCKQEFEEFHSISTQLEECPHCKEKGNCSEAPKRLIVAGGSFILEGSGWARDNYNWMSSLDNERLKTVIDLLKFILTIDDEEIIKSTIEGIIEVLEEAID